MATKLIPVEVVYASIKQQRLIVLQVEQGATIEEVIRQSGILQLFPEIDLSVQKVGVFSKPRKLSDKVNAGDRVEIYRPLLIDPKEARRRNAKLRKKACGRMDSE